MCRRREMAGVGAVTSSLLEGKLPRCQDGYILEPLDAVYLLFKNKGRNATGRNVCFVADRFQFPALRQLLPDPTVSYTPDDFVDCIVCLTLASIAVAIGLFVSKHVWERLDSCFASIHPSHKKWYVVANLSKSFFLGTMTLSSRYWIETYNTYYLDQPVSMVNIKRCGMLYIATDLVALFMVPKLPRSTIMHHVVTTLLIIIVSMVNIDIDGFAGFVGVCKMALLYGIFSTMAFLVNAYLALRVVYPQAKWLPVLVRLSLWPYVLCCVCNWSVHLLWLLWLLFSWNISILSVLYLAAISVMVNDDIVLIKWLVKRSSPVLAREQEEKKEQ